jgi:hypothetical protein
MNEMMLQLMYLRQLTGGESWTHGVFLAGVFLVVLFRRDQIISPYMFRVSIILFVLSFILPIILNTILQYALSSRGFMRGGFAGGDEAGAFFQVLASGTGPVLFGMSVVFCILSMLPPQSRYPAPPQRPPGPHPLD